MEAKMLNLYTDRPITRDSLQECSVDDPSIPTMALHRSVTEALNDLDHFPSLGKAKITRIEHHSHTKGTPHEYLLCHVTIEGAPETWNVWIRQDRRALIRSSGGARGSLILLGSSASIPIEPADTVTIISNGRSVRLQGDSRPIEVHTFPQNGQPTVEAFLRAACITSASAVAYKLVKENCWFYAGAVLSILRQSYPGGDTNNSEGNLTKLLKSMGAGNVKDTIGVLSAEFAAWKMAAASVSYSSPNFGEWHQAFSGSTGFETSHPTLERMWFARPQEQTYGQPAFPYPTQDNRFIEAASSGMGFPEPHVPPGNIRRRPSHAYTTDVPQTDDWAALPVWGSPPTVVAEPTSVYDDQRGYNTATGAPVPLIWQDETPSHSRAWTMPG